MGLEGNVPDLEAWVRVTAVAVESDHTLLSPRARQVIDELERAGIEVRAEPYVIPDSGAKLYRLQPPGEAVDRVRAAILVRARDHDAAVELFRDADLAAEQRRHRLADAVEPLSDAELTRQALNASDELKREAGADE